MSKFNFWEYRNDSFAKKAKERGEISRAYYKIAEISDKYNIIKQGDLVIDLGANPGGWSKFAYEKGAKVIATDINNIESIPPEIIFVKGDITIKETQEKIKKAANKKKTNVIMSDIAPKFKGVKKTDHIISIEILNQCYEFAKTMLAKNGVFIAKFFGSIDNSDIIKDYKKYFNKKIIYKPKASRKESAENYLILMDFYDGDI